METTPAWPASRALIIRCIRTSCAYRRWSVCCNCRNRRFYSIVVFAGHKGFKGTVPPHAVPVEKLIPLIRKRNEKLLSPEAASQVLKKIEEARLGVGKAFPGDAWSWLRLALVVLLLVAGWFAFGGEVQKQIDRFEERVEMRSAPEKFHADGQSQVRTGVLGRFTGLRLFGRQRQVCLLRTGWFKSRSETG